MNMNDFLILPLLFILSLLGVWGMRYYLLKEGILDQLDPRKPHTVPTPVGAGVPVMALILGALGILTSFQPAILALTAILAVVCWYDDRHDLSARFRFMVQILVVSAAFLIGSIPPILAEFSWIPGWVQLGILFIFLLGFMNAYNFMDGIDGITGTQTVSLTLGMSLILTYAHLGQELFFQNLMIASVIAGFLVFNWHPARIFIGDVGAVPLGFLMAYQLIQLVNVGYLEIALILPLYYYLDSAYAVIGQTLRGQRPWLPHRNFFFHRAILQGQKQSRVCLKIAEINVVLLGFAFATFYLPSGLSFGLALLTTVAFIYGVLLRK